MKCSNCGAENQSGQFCMNCGSPLIFEDKTHVYVNNINNPEIQPKLPTSTLVMSMIAFCVFFFLGLPALILTIQSRDAFHMGDMEKFNQKNKSSRTCSIISFILAGAIALIYIIFWIVMMIGLAAVM